MRNVKNKLPSKEILVELFEYKDGQLIAKTSSFNGKKKAGNQVGHVDTNGYRVVKVGTKSYKAHRIIWALTREDPGEYEIDHINGKRDDNRLENLRLVTAQENSRNLRKARMDNKCGFLGVHYKKAANAFVAQIHTGSKYLHLGVFATPEEASEAYHKAKSNLHTIESRT